MDTPISIVGFAGSLRKGSYNRRGAPFFLGSKANRPQKSRPVAWASEMFGQLRTLTLRVLGIPGHNPFAFRSS